MEIITDSFNKKGECPYCESTFFYNLTDIEEIKIENIVAKELAEKFMKESGYNWFQTKGQMIKCPCCSRYIVIKNPSIVYRKHL